MTDTKIDAAVERGRIAWAAAPRAASARYDARLGKIVVELTNGCTFSFPPLLAQDLQNATAAQLSGVEVLGGGYGLHWESLDVDFTVPGLLNGVFGTAAYMARRGGQARTPGKAKAARRRGEGRAAPENLLGCVGWVELLRETHAGDGCFVGTERQCVRSELLDY